MPIYEYHCLECGHTKDVLQKVSDPLLTECPACEKSSFSKKVSAPKFKLKGTGWYETDFKDKPADNSSSTGGGSSSGADSSKGSTKKAAAQTSPDSASASSPAAASDS